MKTNKLTEKAHIDHLVIAADSLDEGVRWCQTALGLTPGPGGTHALFGTHNRLIRLESAAHPLAYLEIIAIDPSVTPTRDAHLRRWFDLDVPSIHQQLKQSGPRLLHWVASVPNITASVANLRALGIDRGQVIEASRPTPQGLLRWKMTVRDDGQRLFGGALPSLIEWGTEHPALSMAESAMALNSLNLQHPQSEQLQSALAAIGIEELAVTKGPPGLSATLTRADGSSLRLAHTETA
jgi:hypothetical protein